MKLTKASTKILMWATPTSNPLEFPIHTDYTKHLVLKHVANWLSLHAFGGELSALN